MLTQHVPRLLRAVVASIFVVLAGAAVAVAFQALPPGKQVNDDPAAGIDKNKSVSGEDPRNADVVGGALTAGKPAVPWSIFRQLTSGHDQIFARSFAGATWTTRGNGTVGGRSDTTRPFPGSLNFDQGQDGEAPQIDFAGTGRTVPWATWYENTTGSGFNHNNVFASRFDNTGDANQGKWIFAGQSRGTGGGSVAVPSLNIHPNRDAENPSVAGGSAVDPTKPGPWVSWQERTSAPVNGKFQIFVERPIGPGAANCDGVTPAGHLDGTGHVPAIGGFCFQQTGVPRVGQNAADPSLNVDPTRNGIEPDIAFTGPSDSVPWVVWSELGNSGIGLHNNQMVFAARGDSDGLAADGGFHWVAVGNKAQFTIDTQGEVHQSGFCAEAVTIEAECSINLDPNHNAEHPRLAAGTMNPANPTVPWAVWDEKIGHVHRIVVARLVGTGATAGFETVNNDTPISSGSGDATRPDITFSGNTPYVTWRQNVGGVDKGFAGHFTNAEDPTFVLDQSNIPLTPTAEASVGNPVSSSCTANPFNADGTACQGGATGTPFFLFTNGVAPLGLFAGGYRPNSVFTAAASNIGSTSATLNGSLDPRGAATEVSFEFGTTTAYGTSTTPQTTGADEQTDRFIARVDGLPAGTTIHYRLVAKTDFATVVGADQTFTTTGG